MAHNSCFGQYHQLLSKHLALLAPPSAPALPAFFYCFGQFAKKVAQNRRGFFVEIKAKPHQSSVRYKRVPFYNKQSVVILVLKRLVKRLGGCRCMAVCVKASKTALKPHPGAI